jgi:hypothetical protein
MPNTTISVIEDRGFVFDGASRPTAERIACFTSLCRLQSGAILCGFQNGAKKHSASSTARLCRSDDLGVTWHDVPFRFATRFNGIPGSLSSAELVEVEPGRLLLFSTWFDRTDPERPLFDPVTEGLLRSKQLMAESRDEGRTWSDWREIATEGLTGCASTGPILRWTDGAIAFPFESFKEFDDLRPARHAAWLVLSRDGGRSFSSPLQVAQHPEHAVYYWDQRLCLGRSPGEFTALFWTHDLQHKRDLTVHLRHAAIRGERIDGEPIRATPLPGQIAAPVLLEDGRLLAFVVDRDRPGTMTLWISPDSGRTWPPESRLLIYTHDERAALSQGREEIDFKQYWEDMGKWTFGHPAACLLPEGWLLLAWYAGVPNALSIHWARVRVT